MRRCSATLIAASGRGALPDGTCPLGGVLAMPPDRARATPALPCGADGQTVPWRADASSPVEFSQENTQPLSSPTE
ncbi:hypothetical protein [Pandoravirus japonicus]|uniref:Uncharacterized protein n=1 Tax=Pandoravirus japonicus TaxID=2823154 RepID=A0A811BNP6_9VIRU|nr:hypothetical protein [Pandoravirus japonicus]